ncbi:sensor histidine kinase, partial [Thermodesulfobacteriota bacterium]
IGDSWFEVVADPVWDESGKIVEAVHIITDITMRKKAEEELNQAKDVAEESRDRIDGILKSVADGLIVTDIYNRILLMNPAAEDLLGTRLSEVIKKPIEFAIQDNTLRDRLKNTLEKKKTDYEFDFEIPVDNQMHPTIMRARTSGIKDKHGKQRGIVSIIHDVTYEREVDRMKTEFLSTAAHELRTPLTSIQGFSEILITRDNLEPERQQKYLSYINTQAVSLGKIINDLLDISRIEAGKGFNLYKEAFDLGNSIKKIVELFRLRGPSHGFETNVPEGPLTVFADQGKVQQLMENLLSNAVKYSPAGGKIRITARKSEEFEREKAEKSISIPSSFIISVEDEGIGMTTDQVKQAFDKFWRANASSKAIDGTGLGMSIVKYIVEAHGGTVWVESELGKGTTVTFEIPGY